MDSAGRDYYPPGDFRVSDAERDLALSELSEALQAGRITVGEFDQRSGQVLGARTGKELTAPLADLPPAGRAPAVRAAAVERDRRGRAPGIIVGASVAAVCFAAAAASAAQQGLSIPVPPAMGFNWAGVLAPGVIAVMLVVLVIFLSVRRTDRS
jgi:hypothetical protein